MSGPNLITDLVQVLLRFRLYSVAIAGDVSDMFLNISMLVEDPKYHRFLIKGDKGEPVVCQSCSHIFGSRGSVCIACGACKRNATKHEEDKLPRAAETIKKSTLMDDGLDSVKTKQQAIQLIKDMKYIYEQIGMQLRKWISSEPEVLVNIPPEDRAQKLDMGHMAMPEQEMLSDVKALGLIYMASSDEFTFRAIKPTAKGNKWTKLAILKVFMTLYDPLGFVVPFVVVARLIFQECWLRKLGWKDTPPQVLEENWNKWISQLEMLPTFKIPRCVQDRCREELAESYEVHVFSDASEKAYGSVAYLLTRYQDGSIHVGFILARARVAPMKHTWNE